MTLHDAIIKVLSISGTAMTSTAIAEEINLRGLYSHRDGRRVRANQISARVSQYAHLFTRSDGLIDLQRQSPVTAQK